MLSSDHKQLRLAPTMVTIRLVIMLAWNGEILPPFLNLGPVCNHHSHYSMEWRNPSPFFCLYAITPQHHSHSPDRGHTHRRLNCFQQQRGGAGNLLRNHAHSIDAHGLFFVFVFDLHSNSLFAFGVSSFLIASKQPSLPYGLDFYSVARYKQVDSRTVVYLALYERMF